MSTQDPSCACNYGDDSTDDAKQNCWAMLVPNDLTDPSKGYKKCEDMPPGSGDKFSKNCDDNVGPDGMACYTVGGETDKDGNYVENTGKCVSRPKIPKYLGLGKKKCIGTDKAGNCNLWGTSGPDCRACKRDGNDDTPHSFTQTIASRCKLQPKPANGGGSSSSDTDDAAAVAGAKQALASFEILAAAAAAQTLAPILCGSLENSLASADSGDEKPIVQALSNLLGCGSSTPAPSPSPSPASS